ncbi:MAG: RNA-binding protein [Alphaproteobacteria bacterium]|nr:RNA-binding protein [Alphaproteobacteria bacterium]
MLAAISDNDGALRERRCIVTGATAPEDRLVRFVVGPDADIVPDLDAKLPGRGLWVAAERATLAKAVAKQAFAKAAKATVKVAEDLPDHVERLLVARMQSDLGLARRAGLAFLGFDNVLRAMDAKVPPRLLIEASDGAADGRRKLANAAFARGIEAPTIDGLTSDELGLALGRENVIHAAVKPGALADRLLLNATRLQGFRPRPAGPSGSNPVRNERE